jgi:hypothetical protein
MKSVGRNILAVAVAIWVVLTLASALYVAADNRRSPLPDNTFKSYGSFWLGLYDNGLVPYLGIVGLAGQALGGLGLTLAGILMMRKADWRLRPINGTLFTIGLFVASRAIISIVESL